MNSLLPIPVCSPGCGYCVSVLTSQSSMMITPLCTPTSSCKYSLRPVPYLPHDLPDRSRVVEVGAIPSHAPDPMPWTCSIGPSASGPGKICLHGIQAIGAPGKGCSRAGSILPARTKTPHLSPSCRSRKDHSLLLTDPLNPFRFHQQPPMLRAVLSRERDGPHHPGPRGSGGRLSGGRAAVSGRISSGSHRRDGPSG